MNEIIFLVENDIEGGFTARTLGESIFTEAENLWQLEKNVREAVICHFDEKSKPKEIRLNYAKGVKEIYFIIYKVFPS